jgi:hypothetical protein
VLYKVTPMLTPAEPKKADARGPAKDPSAPREPRKRRKSVVFDAEGNEVLITMMCLKCRQMKPLAMFGLRKMADGAIRNQPWCRTCRSGAGAKKPKADATLENSTPLAKVLPGAVTATPSSDVVTGATSSAPVSSNAPAGASTAALDSEAAVSAAE